MSQVIRFPTERIARREPDQQVEAEIVRFPKSMTPVSRRYVAILRGDVSLAGGR